MRGLLFAFAVIIAPCPAFAQTLSLPDRVVDGLPAAISASGLPPGEPAELTVIRTTEAGATARSVASFVVAPDGTLDPSRDAAVDGDYRGVSAAGPFWAMRPIEPAPAEGRGRVTAILTIGGREAVRAVTPYSTLAQGVSVQEVIGFAGARLYRPDGDAPTPVIIVLGGSEGGSFVSRQLAGRLAGLGYAALALPYYNPSWSREALEGLPRAFADIPVERLEQVRDWISARPDLDPDRIGLYGVSKGGEFAVIAASRYPWLRAVAAIVPSDVVWEGWGTGGPDGTHSSFSWRGQPLPFVPYIGMTEAIAALGRGERRTLLEPHVEGRRANPYRAAAARIPIETYCGALLVAGGDQDLTWPSGIMARAIAERRAEYGLATTVLTFADAGHALSDTGWSPLNFPGYEAQAAPSAVAQTEVWAATAAFFARSLRDDPAGSGSCSAAPPPQAAQGL